MVARKSPPWFRNFSMDAVGALGIATFMACNETTEVKKAMEMTTMGQVLKWGKKHIGDSLASLRRKFFPTQKKEWKR